jgi:hypothetical protein
MIMMLPTTSRVSTMQKDAVGAQCNLGSTSSSVGTGSVSPLGLLPVVHHHLVVLAEDAEGDDRRSKGRTPNGTTQEPATPTKRSKSAQAGAVQRGQRAEHSGGSKLTKSELVEAIRNAS